MSPRGGWGLPALWFSHKDRVWAWHYQSWAWAWNVGVTTLSGKPRWQYQSWAWAWNVGVVLLISTAAHHHTIPSERDFEESSLPSVPHSLPSVPPSLPSVPPSLPSVPPSSPTAPPSLPISSPVIKPPPVPNASTSIPNAPPPPPLHNTSNTLQLPSPSYPQLQDASLPLDDPEYPQPAPEEPPVWSGGKMTDVLVCKVILASGILVFWAAFWIIHLIGILYGYRRLHQRRGTAAEAAPGGQVEGGVLGVSILKPLVGTPMDPHLATNLETFFTLNYPKFELLFCIQEEGDPTIVIVQQLMKKHPHVDASFFTGGKEVGVNPKINNMQPGYLAAKHELLLISDSGLMMKEDTLTDMVSHMTPHVGIVHQMPFCCDRKGWPAVLEKVYFGTGHARMYLFLGMLDALGLGVNCCTGMSCLMRKKVLDEAGGISAFGIYLAEDYFFAKYIQDQGWGIRIASQPAWQNAGLCRVKTFLSRLTRWCKLRIAMVPHTLLLEPFSECMVLGLVASWAGCVLLRADYLTFFLFHTLTWSLADWIMLNIVQNGPPPFSKFEFAVSWLFREVSALFLFLHAVWNPVISWRAGAFKLRWWGVAEPINTRVTVM